MLVALPASVAFGVVQVAFGLLGVGGLMGMLGTAATLGVLLSVETLKTCAVPYKMTRSRHDSNRELIAQGLANIASNGLGGIFRGPAAGSKSGCSAESKAPRTMSRRCSCTRWTSSRITKPSPGFLMQQ